MVGIANGSAITWDNLSYLTNSSNIPELFIRSNWMIYGGIFFFVMLLLFWVILIIVAYKIDRNNVLRDTMYSGAVISVLSFIIRGIYIIEGGIRRGLLNDSQLWIFPLITILIAAYLYATKRN